MIGPKTSAMIEAFARVDPSVDRTRSLIATGCPVDDAIALLIGSLIAEKMRLMDMAGDALTRQRVIVIKGDDDAR